MLGLFELYDLQFKVHHVWGIPYVSNHHKWVWKASLSRPESVSFLNPLRWFHEAPSKRRVPFPSWSWAGWFEAAHMVIDRGTLTANAELWTSVDSHLVDTEFSMCLESVDGAIIDWTPTTAAQPDVIQDLRELDWSRFFYIATAVGRVLPAVSGKSNVYSLEPERPEDATVDITIRMDLEGYSPNTHELYALI
jgi:hypothetical protein